MSPFSHNDRASCQKLEHTEAGQRGEKVAATCSAPQQLESQPSALGQLLRYQSDFQQLLAPLLKTECLARLAAGLTLQSISHALLQRLLFLFFPQQPL